MAPKWSHLHWYSLVRTNSMLSSTSTMERDHERAFWLDVGIPFWGFHEPTYADVCIRRLSRGDIAMARKANGKRFCKLVLTENGGTTTVVSRGAHRRPQVIDRHNRDPYYPMAPDSGVHLAEMLLNPKGPDGWISKRDAICIAIGFFFFRLISYLAEATAFALI